MPGRKGPVLLQMLALLKGFDLDKLVADRARISSTPGSSAPSSPTPTARPSTATPSSSTCRCRRCCRRPTTPSGASWWARRPPWSSAPAASRASAAGHRQGRARGRRGRRRADVRRLHTGHGADERSSAAARCVGDTVHIDVIDRHGNMFTATPSGGWLQSSPVIPALGLPLGTRGADVLAGGGPAGLAGARQAAALDAVGRHGAARRRALHELGHARRRPAGPVELPVLPAPRGMQRTPKMNLQEAIDAPAWHIEHFPLSFWPRTARPGVLVVEGRAAAGDHRGAAAPRPQGRGRPRLVRRPPDAPPARTACGARPPPTRAACRATPRGGDQTYCHGEVDVQPNAHLRAIGGIQECHPAMKPRPCLPSAVEPQNP